MPVRKSRKKKQTQVSPHMARVVDRNITTLLEVRRQMDTRRSPQARFADWIAGSCGNPAFAYAHAVWFTVWILWNTGWLGLPAFDPYPFGLLTMVVSLEAIFLSMFVLISQNRMSELSEQRSDLDLQINLLSEYEVTKLLKIADAIADHLGLEIGTDPELDELEKEIVPEDLLREMELKKLEVGLLMNGHTRKHVTRSRR